MNPEPHNDETADNKEKLKINRNAQRQWIIVGAAFFVFSLILAVFVFFLVRNMRTKPLPKTNPEISSQESGNKTKLFDRIIDGLPVEKGEENLAPFAVMIDNHVDARPQSGLEKAQLIFEAEVEGGITRLLAFFAGLENVNEIGPVRSARPYFLDWSNEYSALYVHVGGSPEALALILKEDLTHINEFYNEKYFWRDNIRSAPHNVMTSSELMREYMNERGMKNGSFLAWKYSLEEQAGKRVNQVIDIGYRRKYFDVSWKYDFENQKYLRYQGGEFHKTANGDYLSAKNVIIIKVEQEEIDEKLRLKVSSLGEGDAIVCREGVCEEGVWRKLSGATRLRFYNRNNSEIPLARGTSWVQVVDPGYEIEINTIEL
jgi:hypothetical protein